MSRDEDGTFHWVTPLGRTHARPPVALWEPIVSTTCRTPEVGYPAKLAAAEDARTTNCHAAGLAVARFDWAEWTAATNKVGSGESPCSTGKADKAGQVQQWFDDRMAQAAAARDQHLLHEQFERDFINQVADHLYGPDALDTPTPAETPIAPQISISHQQRDDDNPPPFCPWLNWHSSADPTVRLISATHHPTAEMGTAG